VAALAGEEGAEKLLGMLQRATALDAMLVASLSAGSATALGVESAMAEISPESRLEAQEEAKRDGVEAFARAWDYNLDINETASASGSGRGHSGETGGGGVAAGAKRGRPGGFTGLPGSGSGAATIDSGDKKART